jgi:diguanylate cyclase (GGDEF)-like protein
MSLDVQSLLVVMMINMIALSIAIPVIMGWRVSPAARWAQCAMVMQTIGWSSLVVSRAWAGLEMALSVLAMVGLATGMAMLWQSMRGWLGPRPGGRLVWLLALAMPLGYALGYGNYPLRAGWSNIGLALQIGLVCVALLWPAPQASRRWRLIMAASLAAVAVVTTWRGVLGAFYTDLYPTLRTPHPVNLAAMLLSNLTVVINAVGMLVAWREEAERALQTLARTDPLTGLLNRRALEQAAAALIAQARRHGDPLCLLLIDLDGFKAINDRHGHAAGDRALRTVADLVQGTLRPGDLAARWGGEEFCLLLARSGAEAGAAFDARLRAALAERSGPALGFALDFSTGLSVLDDDDDDLVADDLQNLLQRADAALYRAKDAGRGRLVAAGARADAPPDSGPADQPPRQPA